MIFVLALFIGFTPMFSHAGVIKTPTHYYITSPNVNKLIIEDRRTGIVTSLNFKRINGSLQVYRNEGYLFSEHGRVLNKIDLESNTFVSCLHLLSSTSTPMIIRGDYGFIRDHYVDDIIVINLKTFTIEPPINVPHYRQSIEDIVVHDDSGYCVSTSNKTVYVLDLTYKTKTPLAIKGPANWNQPIHMVVHQDKGYISDRLVSDIHVLDLKTNKYLHSIHTGPCPRKLFVHGDKLFVHCTADPYGASPSLEVIDLTTDKVINVIEAKIINSGPILYKDTLYLIDDNKHELIAVDLDTGCEKKRLSGFYPTTLVFHQNKGYIPAVGGYIPLDLETLTFEDQIDIPDVQPVIPKGIVFKDRYAVMTTYKGHHLYDLDQREFVNFTVNSNILDEEVVLFAGRYGYYRGGNICTLSHSGRTVDILECIFTPSNAELICNSLFGEETNVVPDILNMLARDEIDLATETLCEALSYQNKYACAFVYYALKYGRFGGEDIKGKYGRLPEQWADHYLKLSDPETITSLEDDFGGSRIEVKKRIQKK